MQEKLFLALLLIAQVCNLCGGHCCSALERSWAKESFTKKEEEKVKNILQSVIQVSVEKSVEKKSMLGLTLIRKSLSGSFWANINKSKFPFQQQPQDVSWRPPFDSFANSIQPLRIVQNRKEVAKRFAQVRAQYAQEERKLAQKYAQIHRLA